MAQSDQVQTIGSSPNNAKTGNELRGLGDWHVRTLSLFDGHQQNKKQVSISAASREHQVSPFHRRQERTEQSQVDERSSGPLQRAFQTQNHAAEAVSRSHHWSNHSNHRVDSEPSPELSFLQIYRAPSTVSEFNKITRDLYFQGKLICQRVGIMSRGANRTTN